MEHYDNTTFAEEGLPTIKELKSDSGSLAALRNR
jgi:hypothetical protein